MLVAFWNNLVFGMSIMWQNMVVALMRPQRIEQMARELDKQIAAQLPRYGMLTASIDPNRSYGYYSGCYRRYGDAYRAKGVKATISVANLDGLHQWTPEHNLLIDDVGYETYERSQ